MQCIILSPLDVDTPCWNDEGGVRIWRTTRLVNIKTETTVAGQIGDWDLMNYRRCVVNLTHQQ